MTETITWIRIGCAERDDLVAKAGGIGEFYLIRSDETRELREREYAIPGTPGLRHRLRDRYLPREGAWHCTHERTSP